MENNKIPINEKASPIGETLSAISEIKRKTARALLDNARLMICGLILLVLATSMTTDIKITSINDIASLGLNFFVFIFCSYAMLINMEEMGKKQGLSTSQYQEACKRFNTLKDKIILDGLQAKLTVFCSTYIKEEMKSTKASLLGNVGIDFEKYEKEYIGKELKDIAGTLTKPQIKAIKAANNIKPLKLTAEMILDYGRRGERKAPLGINPKSKDALFRFKKAITTATTTIFMISIVFDAVVNFSWGLLVAVLFKLLSILINGVSGYQFGFENITEDKVSCMKLQCDFMEQFLQSQVIK